MGETVDKRFYRTLQESLNLYSIWHQGDASKTTPLLANSNSNCMRHTSSTLDDLHNENGVYQANRASRPEKIFFKYVNYLSRTDYNNETKNVGLPNKCNGISEKRENQIYVWEISSKWNNNKNNRDDGVQKQSPNSKIKSENLSDITKVCCPNRSSQLPLGKLRRIGILAGNTWTKEEPKTSCRFVIPNFQSTQATISKTMCHVPKNEEQDGSQEGHNNLRNPLMIVDMIANKKDRKRVANYLNCDLEGGEPSTCICYMEFIKQYGFDHIIIIGERYAGLLFLDCYSRVFEWDDSSCGVLWPLGDYFNEAPKVSLTYHVIWNYESDGTVVELEVAKDDSPDELTFDISTTVAKKKKNSKKKNSKKKQY